jgi:hypothetical protein
MHFPLIAMADAGGWKDVTTLVRCYQQTDEQTLLAVMANTASRPEHQSIAFAVTT